MTKYQNIVSSVTFVSCLLAATVGHAAMITVTTIEDTITIDGECSLREALINSELNLDTTGGDCSAGSGRDLIRLDTLSGTILLSSELPTITDELVIRGPGPDTLSINGSDLYQIFEINTFYSNEAPYYKPVTIVGLTLEHGAADEGGAIFNGADLTLRRCKIINNQASTGAGIFTLGFLAVDESLIANNSAIGWGGGIFVGGGGQSFGGSVTISSSTIADNSASSGGGYHIYAGYTEISESTFRGNYASFRGGAIFLEYVSGTIENSAIHNNQAQQGGGIFTISRAEITNTTISSNIAEEGGGIYIVEDNGLKLANVTITLNQADTGGGIGGYDEQSAVSTVTNSIIANNVLMGDPSIPSDCGPAELMTSVGYNIFSTGGGCNPDGVSDTEIDHTLVEIDVLKPLAVLGGKTLTHGLRLKSNNPALSGGDPNGCFYADEPTLITTDQRGFPRPNPTGQACDIGAFENRWR